MSSHPDQSNPIIPNGQPRDREEATCNAPTDRSSLTGRRVVVALGGGISCYKTAALVSEMVQSGADVRVVMTESATRFVTPLTFRSLSGHSVISSVWEDPGEGRESPHVAVARWCHLMIVAPATADLIAKLAAGICDDPVSLVAAALPQDTAILMAPAMNSDMWAKPTVRRNLATVRQDHGAHLVGPETGWQACRSVGVGRMSDPDVIIDAAAGLLAAGASPLAGVEARRTSVK